MKVLHKFVETTQVDYMAFFGTRKILLQKFSVEKEISFVAPIEWSFFTSAKGAVESEHVETGTCNRTGAE